MRPELRVVDPADALEERDVGAGGLDQNCLGDVKAQRDYYAGYLIELHVEARIEKYGARPKPDERRRIADEVRAELWSQATTPEHLSALVDRRREVGRRGER